MSGGGGPPPRGPPRGALPIPKAMFNKDGGGAAGGVYVGGTFVSKTAPARTLFILGAPAEIPGELIEAAFSRDFGFVAFRRPRPNMIFVDYKEVGQATVAMRKHQGQKFEGYEHCSGLAIDYDKDPVAKRNMQYEKERDYKLRTSLLETYVLPVSRWLCIWSTRFCDMWLTCVHVGACAVFGRHPPLLTLRDRL
jgi:hypothetical protein